MQDERALGAVRDLLMRRCPPRDAARTAVLSPRWRHVWTSSLTTSDINGGEDRISRLPDKLLSNIVTRLPLKDAARTSTLSPRWRRVWASTPLVLCDADLFPVLSYGSFVSHTITDTISCILAVHQGPVRSICLTYSFHCVVAHDVTLSCKWLRVLADKGVESLEFFNHPSSIFGSTSTSLPSEVLLVTSLVRLSLRHWDFPSTDCLRRAAYVFPRLCELYLCDIHIGATDIDRLLQYSPELEIFALIDSKCMPPNVRIRNCNLQCAIFWMSVANMFEVLAAPSLERLILWCRKPDGQSIHDCPIRLSIGHTPNLKVLGYLDPGIHVLKVGSTVIKSGGGDEPIGEPNSKFWLEASPIKCLKSTLRKVVVKNFRGYGSELSFLRFIWERAKVLQELVVDLASGDDPALIEEIITKLKSEVCVKRVEGRKSMFMLRSGGSKWCLNIASNLTLSDPFDF
ncbi:F-box/FBD/LRR-repeat protein [Panicum miliaceum]|uniref:F-box/FBD/LRR-repeat protein n=1 Tax=Panicum miliaceum TaxID=4540 RepID=A0A3L6RW32_PANMI|nr:F-box/FBD/LRR-repeat protein [Panicum miliaceum]